MRASNGFAHAEEKKSLSEQIEDVKKSRMPKSEKIATLKACGLRDKEISEILSLCTKRLYNSKICNNIRC